MARTNTAEDRTNDRNREIADTILQQLGRECLGLLGAHNPGVYQDDSGHGVEFSIRGSRTVNRIYITLEPEDTYKIAFVRIVGGKISRTTGRYNPVRAIPVYSADGLFAEDLHDTIEARTGLYVSLRPRNRVIY